MPLFDQSDRVNHQITMRWQNRNRQPIRIVSLVIGDQGGVNAFVFDV